MTAHSRRRTTAIALAGATAVLSGTVTANAAEPLPNPLPPVHVVRTTQRALVKPLPLSPAGPGTYLLWNKGPNRVSLVRNGRIIRTMPATDNDWKTPNGDYRIRYKSTGRYYEQGRWWTLGYFMGFYRRPGATDDIGFHRVPNYGNTWYQPLSTVGKPGWTSHGCLRLLPTDAAAAWNFASVGTVVKVRS